jgi:hypothetical protein
MSDCAGGGGHDEFNGKTVEAEATFKTNLAALMASRTQVRGRPSP